MVLVLGPMTAKEFGRCRTEAKRQVKESVDETPCHETCARGETASFDFTHASHALEPCRRRQ